MSLATKALLVNIRISQWTGRKLDKEATGTVETTYSTEKHAGNYTKKLLPGAKELAEIQRLAGAIRAFFYEQTLPWETDGARILSSKNYLDFTAAFRAKKEAFDRAVSEFISAYPALKEAARAKLGTLYRDGEYPTASYLVSAFSCDASFLPLPDVSDFRVEILDAEKNDFLSRMANVESAAVRECWTRLHDVVAKAATKLQDDKAIFRDSLIDNITEICALLPKLNVTDCPDLEAMRVNVEKLVSGISADAVRESVDARKDAAAKLDDITAKMSAFMGN